MHSCARLEGSTTHRNSATTAAAVVSNRNESIAKRNKKPKKCADDDSLPASGLEPVVIQCFSIIHSKCAFRSRRALSCWSCRVSGSGSSWCGAGRQKKTAQNHVSKSIFPGSVFFFPLLRASRAFIFFVCYPKFRTHTYSTSPRGFEEYSEHSACY